MCMKSSVTDLSHRKIEKKLIVILKENVASKQRHSFIHGAA